MTHAQVTPEQAREALEWWGRGVFDHGAAEQALRTLASMHYEYAVQLEDTTGETRFAMSMYNVTRNPEEAWWTPTPNAPLANHWRFSQTGLKVRIVRRLMADPEVVE